MNSLVGHRDERCRIGDSCRRNHEAVLAWAEQGARIPFAVEHDG